MAASDFNDQQREKIMKTERIVSLFVSLFVSLAMTLLSAASTNAAPTVLSFVIVARTAATP